MPAISVTRLRVRSWIYLPAFLLRSLRIGQQAKTAPGNLGAKVLNDRHRTFWTCTAWESDAAMKAFMLAPPHGPAMRKLLTWCDEASLVRWSQPEPGMPDWPEAHTRLQREGRASKVNHPSENQRRFVIPPPRPDAGSGMRLK